MGQSTHIPLKVNSAGELADLRRLDHGLPWLHRQPLHRLRPHLVRTGELGPRLRRQLVPHQVIYFLMVVGFTYFYTVVIFQQQNIAENLQKNGGFIPGIRPGQPTNLPEPGAHPHHPGRRALPGHRRILP
ncbi:MAG: hypothetical protein U0232_07595 [Thermomicrobiales bacterium]